MKIAIFQKSTEDETYFGKYFDLPKVIDAEHAGQTLSLSITTMVGFYADATKTEYELTWLLKTLPGDFAFVDNMDELLSGDGDILIVCDGPDVTGYWNDIKNPDLGNSGGGYIQ